MKSKKERLEILEQLEEGKISPEEAATFLTEDPEALLNDLENPMEVLEALEGGKISTQQATEKLVNGNHGNQEHAEEVSNVEVFQKGRVPKSGTIWMITSAIGVTILALSAWWMASRLSSAAGMDFWFFVAWLPFLLGLFFIVLAWMSLNSPWIHIRVRSKSDGSSFRLNLGFPIPIGLVKWGISQSSRFGQNVNTFEIENLLENFQKGNLADPIIIHVDDEDDDVEIIIG